MWYKLKVGCTAITVILLFAVNGFAQTDWYKCVSNPVISGQEAGTWEFQVLFPFVFYDGQVFHLWYEGFYNQFGQMGYATSSDCITWIKHESNPVFIPDTANAWDDRRIAPGPVIKIGDTYQMWYNGYDGAHWRVGIATSPDGITWQRFPGNPVFDVGPGGNWDDWHVAFQQMLYVDRLYKTWYMGYDGFRWRIGLATSADGITWERHPSAVFVQGYGWESNGISNACVLFNGTIYEMFYAGFNNENVNQIGYATSSDGITWERYVGNPIIRPGPDYAWDDS